MPLLPTRPQYAPPASNERWAVALFLLQAGETGLRLQVGPELREEGTRIIDNYIWRGQHPSTALGVLLSLRDIQGVLQALLGAVDGSVTHASLGRGAESPRRAEVRSGGSLITLGARSALQGNRGMREGGGSHGYRPAGNGARRAGGASPGATCPDKLRLGASEPWEEVEGEKVEGEAASVESSRGACRDWR